MDLLETIVQMQFTVYASTMYLNNYIAPISTYYLCEHKLFHMWKIILPSWLLALLQLKNL